MPNDRRKSLSTNNVTDLDKFNVPREKIPSVHSMNRLSQDSYLDDVFPPVPNEIPSPTGNISEGIKGIASPGFLREQIPSFVEECVYKYDVCLGYLLHTVECDNTVICVYSFQRNKQFMESMITPLAALPGCKCLLMLKLTYLNGIYQVSYKMVISEK